MHTVPSAPPTSVRVSEVTSSSITVQWGPVDCIHRNGNITGYSVLYREIESAMENRTINIISLQVTITGLTPSTEYTVSVAAVNSAGTGVYSEDDVVQKTAGDVEYTVMTTAGAHRLCLYLVMPYIEHEL